MAEAKTRAVEVAVTILVAAGGVTAAIGVFEAQEHHSAIGWFTACAATFIAAFLLPVTAFILLPWIESISARRPPTVSAKSIPTDNEVPAVKQSISYSVSNLPDGRIVVNVAPRTLVDICKSYKTDFEAESAIQRYLNKWIKVHGSLNNMWFVDSGKRLLAVHVEDRDLPPIKLSQAMSMDDLVNQADRMANQINLSLVFSHKQWVDQITTLNHGDSFSALGKINKVDRYGIFLVDCELIDPSQS